MNRDDFIAKVSWEYSNDDQFKGVLPLNHAARERLQRWADVIDAEWRKSHAAEMAMVRKPIVEILLHSSDNAHVSSANVCFEVPTRVVGADPNGRIIETFIAQADGFSLLGGDEYTLCDTVSESPAELEAFLKVFDTRYRHLGPENCRVEIKGGTAFVTPSCFFDYPIPLDDKIKGANLLSIEFVSNRLVFRSGLFQSVESEGEMVAVLAHELGHYYRAHPLYSGGDYGYFYRIEETNSAHKPVALKEWQSRGERLETLWGLPTVSLPFPGQRFHPLMFRVMERMSGDLGSSLCLEDEECLHKQQEFQKEFTAAQGSERFSGYPRLELSQNDYVAYERLESLFLELIQTIRRPQQDGRDVPGRGFSEAVASSMAISSDLLPPLVDSSKTFFEVVSESDKALRSLYREFDELLGEFRDEKIGMYTTEQEADDFAVESLFRIGLPTKLLEELLFSFAFPEDGDQALASRKGVDAKTCKAWQENSWKDVNGNWLHVPMGDMRIWHHSACFRVFNAEREAEAHAFSRMTPRDSDGSLSLLPADDWARQVRGLAAFQGAGSTDSGEILKPAGRVDSVAPNRVARKPLGAAHKGCILSEHQ